MVYTEQSKLQLKLIEIASGVAEWIRRSVSNLVGYTRVGSNPVADSANHKPAANSAVHPSEVGK